MDRVQCTIEKGPTTLCIQSKMAAIVRNAPLRAASQDGHTRLFQPPFQLAASFYKFAITLLSVPDFDGDKKSTFFPLTEDRFLAGAIHFLFCI